ncbi:TetR/AcrR family transcriptional regulator [Tunturiibacter lichenicola]|uniref:TetR/AcrR family transcriptional regulator n=1 Tax=Tunturiibacter lichenicola TaxID=2051959 RepID=UPI0021B473DC|nr:TetR/AcrR family transcriptional regulator [Edaphobacter lichenicola]
MTKKKGKTTAVSRVEAAPRKLRADALQNRERILQVAKQAFTDVGPDVSLDEIAKLAVVGPGTLYRHFPTRDALVGEVYRTELEKLKAAEQRFSETLPPLEALRAWMLTFVDYMATKLIILPAINLMACGPEKVFEQSGPLITTAIDSLMHRAVASGDLRGDVSGMDMLRALAGLWAVAPTQDWPVSARKMVEILLLGARRV